MLRRKARAGDLSLLHLLGREGLGHGLVTQEECEKAGIPEVGILSGGCQIGLVGLPA